MANERREVPEATKRLLWGIAAGRCEFKGCNKLLYTHDVTGTVENLAEKAHINAVQPGGARYIEQEDKNSITNLMLVCPSCHTIIDRDQEFYSADKLFTMKNEHEKRIRILTAIGAEMKSHMVYYTANITDDRLSVDDSDAKRALTSISRYPAEWSPIDIGVHGSYTADRDIKYYNENAQNLEKAIKNKVLDVIEQGKSIALFAIAPQPLLIYLGHRLNDKYNVSVFQCHRRESDKWSWREEYSPIVFRATSPEPEQINRTGKIALIFALSSSVNAERITDVIGSEANIYVVSIEKPSRVFVTHPSIMDSFVEKSREVMEQIKQIHGNKKPIHVFPVMPVSLAVRFGMDYMSKTDNPLIIYDEIAGQGFIQALNIGENNDY